jgi:hypothetical protein
VLLLPLPRWLLDFALAPLLLVWPLAPLLLVWLLEPLMVLEPLMAFH